MEHLEKYLDTAIQQIDKYINNNPDVKIADPYKTIIQVEYMNEYGDDVVAFTKSGLFSNTIYIKNFLIEAAIAGDTLIYNALAHELTHARQYRTAIHAWFYQTIFRVYAEREANQIGQHAENWIIKNKLNI